MLNFSCSSFAPKFVYASSIPFTIIHENNVIGHRGFFAEIVFDNVVNIFNIIVDLFVFAIYELIFAIYEIVEFIMNTNVTVKMFEIDFMNCLLCIICTVGLLIALSSIDRKIAHLEEYTKILKKNIDNDVVIINKAEYEMLINNLRLYNLKISKRNKEKNY